MKLVYLTAKEYPATTADHVYIRFLSYAFARILGDRFLLIVRGSVSEDLEGLPIRTVNAPRSLRTFFYFLWLPSFIRSLDDTIVFFCNDFNLLAALAFWKPFFGTRMRICSDWHLMTDTWKDRFVAKSSDALITTSETLREGIIRKTGVAPERVHAVYGGIDVAPYQEPFALTRAELGLPEGYLVGYVGLFRTMGKEKGLRTMIDALAYLPQDVRSVFVGGSAEEIREYQAYAEQVGVNDRCVWVEKQSFDTVVAYERSMDALVIPYPDEPHFRDYGFPMKAYEYVAAEKPVIYSDLPILHEVFEGYGIPFMPSDATSLSQAVIRARVNAYTEKDAQAYTWDEKAKNILSLIDYAKALAG